MRIVSYNILNGGEGRADPLAEILLAQHADVICLIECSHDGVLHRIASRLAMDVVVATAGRDPVAMLSRWPIVESIDHAAVRPGFSGALLEAVVQSPNGREISIGAVHLSARATEERESKRMIEIETVLDAFSRHRNVRRPHILAGDFNANSPTQQIDPDHCKPATKQAWSDNGGSIPRRLVERVLSAGYTDSLRDVHGEAADRMASFTTRDPGQRVDYIFSFGMKPAKAWIEQNRLATYASDHYPVGAELTSSTSPERPT